MKYLALAYCFFTAFYCVAETMNIQFEEKFSPDSFSLISDDYGKTLICTNLISTYSDKNTALPWLPLRYVIPSGFRLESYTVNLNRNLYKTGVNMATYDSFGKNTDKSTNNMGKCDNFPNSETNCILTSSSNWKDLSILNFLVCPFIFDETLSELFFVDSIKIEASITDEQAISNDLSLGMCPDFVKDGLELSEELRTSTSGMSSRKSNADRIDYVVITSENLKDSFKTLVNWKKKKGIYSKILTLEEIYSEYEEKTPQLKIKKAIYDLFINNGLQYVLLGGDDTVVPVQVCFGKVQDQKYTEPIADLTIPTDIYYSCFDGCFDWDRNNNQIYGEISDDINLTPSLCVTRVPVRTPYHAECFTKKIIAYETSTSFSNKLLMAGATLITGSYNDPQISDVQAEGEMIYDGYISPYWNGERIRFFDTGSDFQDGADYDFTASNLFHQIEQGYSFIDINTHGLQDKWLMEKGEGYGYRHSNSQINNEFSIITTASCLTNAFDSSEKGGKNDPCLSESLLRNEESGVIAYLGCSREGWTTGYVAPVITPSGLYTASFYSNLFSKIHYGNNFGKVVASAKNDLIPFCSEYGKHRWIMFGLNPLGDPEMPIFTEHPKEFSDAKLIRKMSGDYIVDTGVEGCRVCMMSSKDFGDSYYQVIDYVDSIEFMSRRIDCDLTITKPGYIPLSYNIVRLYKERVIDDHTVTADLVEVGSFDSGIAEDKYIIDRGKTVIKGKTVVLGPGTEVKKGASLTVSPFIFKENK